MNIIAIGGGMRADSNTNKLVRKVAEASGRSFEFVDLGRLEIKPCTGCSECMMQEGRCPIQDGMQALYEKLLAAEAVILGSPTYYMDVSGGVKCLIDRSLALYYRGIGPVYNPDMPFLGQRPLAGKPCVLVTTVAGAGHEKCMATLCFCMGECHRLNVVAKLAEPVGMGDVNDMPEVLARAAAAGKRLAAALK
jgi:multimeric flavodoxin WrbA